MKNETTETDSKPTQTKAFRNLVETIEAQAKRISSLEQDLLELSARVSGIETLKYKTAKPF